MSIGALTAVSNTAESPVLLNWQPSHPQHCVNAEALHAYLPRRGPDLVRRDVCALIRNEIWERGLRECLVRLNDRIGDTSGLSSEDQRFCQGLSGFWPNPEVAQDSLGIFFDRNCSLLRQENSIDNLLGRASEEQVRVKMLQGFGYAFGDALDHALAQCRSAPEETPVQRCPERPASPGSSSPSRDSRPASAKELSAH